MLRESSSVIVGCPSGPMPLVARFISIACISESGIRLFTQYSGSLTFSPLRISCISGKVEFKKLSKLSFVPVRVYEVFIGIEASTPDATK